MKKLLLLSQTQISEGIHKAYKKRFAWIKYRKIRKEVFYER